MPRPDEQSPTPTPPSGAASWRQVIPGIGLVFGAGLGVVISLLVSTAPTALVIGVMVGAGLGLVVGAMARSHVGVDSRQTPP